MTLYKLKTRFFLGFFSVFILAVTAQNKVSQKNGNWSDPTVWVPAGVPTAASNVTIANGTTVDMNVAVTCSNITVGTGGSASLRFAGTLPSTFVINGDLLINTSASMVMRPGTNLLHAVRFNGNVVNNGTFDLYRNALSFCTAVFSGTTNQSFSGTGTTTELRSVIVDKGNISSILDVSSTVFLVPSDFLTLRSGIFRLSGAGLTLVPASTAFSIAAGAGIELNNSSSVFNFGASVRVSGLLSVLNGTVNVGNANNEDLVAGGGTVSVAGGLLNVAGKYDGSVFAGTFSISGGTMSLPVFASTNTGIAPFHISASGSAFYMSGGLLRINREGGTGAQDLGFVNTGSSSGSVNGGTVQIGDPAVAGAQVITVNTSFPLYHFQVNSPTARAAVTVNSLTILGSVNILTGTLQTTTPLSVGENWLCTGTFSPGLQPVTFSSSAAQNISGTPTANFHHMYFAGAGIKTFSSQITCSGDFSIAAGSAVSAGTGNHTLTATASFVNNGLFTAQRGKVVLNGTSLQTIGGSVATEFYDLTINNPAGATLTQSVNLRGALDLNNGVFNLNAFAFTLLSDAAGTARIGPITGTGDITGNVNVQRYVPGGATGWALLGSPVASALTFQSIDDDLYISCAACPDGYPGGFTSVYTYDESLPGIYDNQASYTPVPSITTPFAQGRGYWIYLSGQNTTIDLTGVPRKFNYSIPIGYTNYGSPPDDGWNLIHNPYPSPVSWTAFRAGNAALNNAYYVYNADLNGGAGGYATFVNGISSPAVGSGGINDNIPMCQGFYVHANAATNITATESVKSIQDNFLRKEVSHPLMRLQLKGSGTSKDETVVYYSDTASATFNPATDAAKLKGRTAGMPFIATRTGAEKFQVKAIAPVTGTAVVQLAISGIPGNTYSISLVTEGYLEKGTCFRLVDKKLNTSIDILKTPYVFQLTDTSSDQRFELMIINASEDLNAWMNELTCENKKEGKIIAGSASGDIWSFVWMKNGALFKTNTGNVDSIINLKQGVYQLLAERPDLCGSYNGTFVVPSPGELCGSQPGDETRGEVSVGAEYAVNRNGFVLKTMDNNQYLISGPVSESPVHAVVQDLNAKIIYNTWFDKGELHLDLDKFNRGIYLLQLITPEGRLVFRLPVY